MKVNCETEMQKLEEENDIKKSKIDRVRNLVKCKSQMTFEDLAAERRGENEKVMNISFGLDPKCVHNAKVSGRKGSRNHGQKGR